MLQPVLLNAISPDNLTTLSYSQQGYFPLVSMQMGSAALLIEMHALLALMLAVPECTLRNVIVGKAVLRLSHLAH